MFSSSVISSDDDASSLDAGSVPIHLSLPMSLYAMSQSQSQTQLSVPFEEAETQISDRDSDCGGDVAAESDYEANFVSAEPNIVGGIFHADPLTQAMSDNAMEAWVAQDAALINCINKHKMHILQTHWLLVGLAGCELRESTKHFGFKGADQNAYMLDAHRRWIDVYEEKVPEPPHDPGMFKKPQGVSKRTWQLALMILKMPINRKASATLLWWNPLPPTSSSSPRRSMASIPSEATSL
jgi:hypothetical protein